MLSLAHGAVRLRLAPHSRVTRRDSQLVVESVRGSYPIAEVLGRDRWWEQLEREGLCDDELRALVAEAPAADRLRLFASIDQMVRRGFLAHTLFFDDAPLATRCVDSPWFVPAAVHADQHYVLSRFACCRVDHGKLRIESPRCHAHVVFHDWRGAASLARFGMGSDVPGLVPELEMQLSKFLAETGLLVPDAEEEADELRQWEFSDFLFHARSREGRHGNPVGGTCRFTDQIEPLAAIKPPMSSQTMPLPKADVDSLKNEDIPFTRVLEGRRSRRADRAEPLSLRQLGEFLFRSARTARFDHTTGVVRRPYPSGGSLHELEIYVAADRCAGLAPGLYHYASTDHALEPLEGSTASLLDRASLAQGTHDRPAVLMIITSRFQRVSWKYQSIAYALTLKNVGGLMQTMYLVATAMGLAPCAIGCGDADLFARISGIPYEIEGSVGEFTLR